jgi:hypothetical protein
MKVSNARGFFCMQNTADYILPLDTDDKLQANYIEKCLEILLNDDSNSLSAAYPEHQ